MTNPTPDLLPCPFCGGKAETVSLFPNDPHPGNTFVRCTSCTCATRRGHITTAIAAWNTRTPRTYCVTVQQAAQVLLDTTDYFKMAPAFDAMQEVEGEGVDTMLAAGLRVLAARAAQPDPRDAQIEMLVGALRYYADPANGENGWCANASVARAALAAVKGGDA
jgi:hypothetical protein